MPAELANNPFRIGGAVSEPFFTDRGAELARVRRALTTPQDHLLLFGPRRMGKTSLLRVAQERLREEGHAVVLADLSTAGSLTEMTTRLLQAVTRELGRQWTEVAASLVSRLRATVTLTPDPASGMLLPALGVSVEPDLAAERRTFGSALDAIEALAAARERHLGVILDEFQEIHRFGGEVAEAHLRGIVQHHRHVSYVLAGSDERLIQAMTGAGRPFYKLLANLEVGPIDAEHLAQWLEKRLGAAGVEHGTMGMHIVRLAGPRTRDVIQLAQAAADLAAPSGKLNERLVGEAFERVVQSSDAPYRALWVSLSRLQQQVLRVLAVRATGLTSAAVAREFSLAAPSGSLVKAVQTLVARDLVVGGEGRYLFDDPFMRGWVLTHTLPDLGMSFPVDRIPDDGDWLAPA